MLICVFFNLSAPKLCAKSLPSVQYSFYCESMLRFCITAFVVCSKLDPQTGRGN